jgi:hypothetical protein
VQGGGNYGRTSFSFAVVFLIAISGFPNHFLFTQSRAAQLPRWLVLFVLIQKVPKTEQSEIMNAIKKQTTRE